MKESKFQQRLLLFLPSHGYLGFPIEYRGRRDCPDLMVFAHAYPGKVAFLELKKPKTGKASNGQLENAKLYAIWGHEVGFAETIDEALAHVRKVFYGEVETADQIQKDNAPHVRHIQRKKAVQRLPNTTN